MTETTTIEKPKARAKSSGKAEAPKPQRIAVAVKALRTAIKALDKVVEARNTIPILSNVLLDAAHGKLTITATDMDIMAVRHLDCEGDGAFRTTIGSHVLAAIAGKVDAEAMLSLTYADGKMKAEAGRARFTMPTLPAEDFPEMVAGDLPHAFELAAFDLAALIEAVRGSISTEETRYYLNGIFLQAAETPGPGGDGGDTLLVLRGVTTDGNRLSQFDLAQPDGAGALDGAIVPRKTVGIVSALLDGLEAPVTIGVSDSKIRFDFGETVLISKLVDGQFPDYRRVIPTGNDKVMRIEPATLLDAVARVMLMCSDKSRAVTFALSSDLLRLTARSAELGEASEELPCDYDGPDFTIGFNGQFVRDQVSRVQGDSCEIAMGDAAAPALVRDANDAARALFVIMPCRV